MINLNLPQGTSQVINIDQSRMSSLITFIHKSNMITYLDDMHVKGNTFKEHLEIFDEILTLLEKQECK